MDENPKLEPGKTLLLYPLVSEIAEVPLPPGQKPYSTLQIAGNTVHIMNYTKESPRAVAENLLRIHGYPYTNSAHPTGWRLGRAFTHTSSIPQIPKGTCWEILQDKEVIGYAFRDGTAVHPELIGDLKETGRSEPGSPDDLLTFNALTWVNP
jgi:hypothetical protein